MRDKTASRLFLLEKKGEKLLHRLIPRLYAPLYDMVTFSRIPYSEARRRARRQRTVVHWIGATPRIGATHGIGHRCQSPSPSITRAARVRVR